MRARITAASALVVLAVIAGIYLFILPARRPGPPLADPALPDENVAGLTIPDFTLTTQDDRPFARENLLGHYTVLCFIFTNCPFICPAMTLNMAALADDLKDTPARFLSISVDPIHDTTARLREHARKIAADPARWTFLTGDFAVVRSIARDALGFDLEPDPNTPITLPDGSSMSNIRHPGHFILVGTRGEVIAFYRSSEPEQLRLLAARLRSLTKP
ncbi:MAG: SCO family protein [Phycisphaerae bacterium]|nr:SCO family protein [Phycisphaerae bacterium]